MALLEFERISRKERSERAVRVGLLGFGTVGSGVYEMLLANQADIAEKVGLKISVERIGIQDPTKARTAPPELFTPDLWSVIDDPEIDVVIEVIGGEELPHQIVRRAIANGKHVVTANKELIAKRGPELLRLAHEQGLDLHYEAAVGGGIPLIQPLKHQLAGNTLVRLSGILNGTTNYILSRMSNGGLSLPDALIEAQVLGFAEADSSSDLEGCDARYKLAILASIAFGTQVCPSDVYCQGISAIEPRDIELAQMFGYELKLLATAERLPGGLSVRVHPAFLPKDHPLSRISGADNALQVRGNFVGDLTFSGKGAGANPTASAVVGDLIDVARNIRHGGSATTPVPIGIAQVLPIEDLVSRFYLRVEVDDEPSVLGAIATILGRHGVSLSSMEMKVLSQEQRLGEIVFFTHPCLEQAFRSALEEIAALNVIRRIANWIRIEGETDELCN
jgi:homoserine dehydrogenase